MPLLGESLNAGELIVKLQHWRGVWSLFGCEGAQMLWFDILRFRKSTPYDPLRLTARNLPSRLERREAGEAPPRCTSPRNRGVGGDSQGDPWRQAPTPPPRSAKPLQQS